MKHEIASILIPLVLCTGCSGNRDGNITSQTAEDSLDMMIDSIITAEFDSDTTSVAEEEDGYDWTPEKFREQHHDEWVVVKQAIDIQQTGKEVDYGKIDKLVRDYVRLKNIQLPADRYKQILKIEEICKQRFDISGYDDSNMGMHVADGTERLFEGYVNWLLEAAARKVKGSGINFAKEEEMVEDLMDVFYDCCDSIGRAFDGSGGWMGVAQVVRIKENFMKSMYAAVLAPSDHGTPPALVAPKQFEDVCEEQIRNYKAEDEWMSSPQTVKRLLEQYAAAMSAWLEYRQQAVQHITSPKLKAEYNHLTHTFAKEHFTHLQNEFHDIGLY